MSNGGSLELSPTGVGVMNENVQTEYWIGASYWDVANTQISAKSSDNITRWWVFNPETVQHGWNMVNGPYRSARDVVLRRVMNPVNLYTRALGQNNPQTLMNSGTSVTDLLISGDGKNYFCNDSVLGWMKYESGNWTSLSIAPSMQLSASFSGSVVCGVDSDAIAYRSANSSFDGDWGPNQKRAAVIGTTVVLAIGSQLYLIDSAAGLTPSKEVDGTCVGVYADASLVWVATDAPSTYISADGGKTWDLVPDVRVVSPGLVVNNGQLFTAVFVPDTNEPDPDEPDPGPDKPGPGPDGPSNQSPTKGGLTTLEITLIVFGVALAIALVAAYLATHRKIKP